jgi:hypothetical protein
VGLKRDRIGDNCSNFGSYPHALTLRVIRFDIMPSDRRCAQPLPTAAQREQGGIVSPLIGLAARAEMRRGDSESAKPFVLRPVAPARELFAEAIRHRSQADHPEGDGACSIIRRKRCRKRKETRRPRAEPRNRLFLVRRPIGSSS